MFIPDHIRKKKSFEEILYETYEEISLKKYTTYQKLSEALTYSAFPLRKQTLYSAH